MPKDNKFMDWSGIRCIAVFVLLLAAVPGFAQLPTGAISIRQELV